MNSFKSLTSVLENQMESVSFTQLEESSGHLLSSMGNVIKASSNVASFDKQGPEAVISGAGSIDTGNVSTKEKVIIGYT